MKRIATFLAIAAFSVLAGCVTDNLATAYDAITSKQVPVKTMEAAVVTANGAITAATTYVRYCTPQPQPVGCDNAAINNTIVPAVKSTQVARNNVQDYIDTHRDQNLGPKSLYDALVVASSTLKSIEDQYNIQPKG